jgi:predicted amidohydrolase
MFKLGMIQMHVEGGNKFRNVQRAEVLIGEAAAGGADVILLPETIDLGWTHPSALTDASPIPEGEPCQMLLRAARTHAVYICAGLVEQAGDQIYNAAVLIDPKGDVKLTHRKLNELDIGHPYYAQGDRLHVYPTEFGTFGVMICADGFAKGQVISRSLGYMGADVILSPCAWAVDGDHDNVKHPYGKTWRDAYIPVAETFATWIIGVSNVGWIEAGPWKGRKCIGASLVVGPSGEVVMQGPYGEEAETILYVDVHPTQRPARGCSWMEHWNPQTEPA